MKKISLIVLALSTSLATFAQNSQPTTMAVQTRFGIKAGVNLAELKTANYPATDPETNLKTSVHAGFLVNIPCGTGGFAVQPELLYSRQGSKMSQKTTIGTVTTTSNFEQDLD